MSQPLGINDAILFISLGYSCLDLNYEWEAFSRCKRPIHYWLLVSYGCVVGIRLIHFLGSSLASSGSAVSEFLLDLRQKKALPRALLAFTWCLALPLFAAWTLLGTRWLWEVAFSSSECLPSEMHLYFTGFWLVLCYIWLAIHLALALVAWLLERRVRKAEVDLRAVADDDTLTRWGEVVQLGNYQLLPSRASTGLSPTEILALPLETVPDDLECKAEQHECPICITSLQPGDATRRLLCGHHYHRACVDLWLLRSVECPLCKRNVRGEGA